MKQDTTNPTTLSLSAKIQTVLTLTIQIEIGGPQSSAIAGQITALVEDRGLDLPLLALLRDELRAEPSDWYMVGATPAQDDQGQP